MLTYSIFVNADVDEITVPGLTALDNFELDLSDEIDLAFGDNALGNGSITSITSSQIVLSGGGYSATLNLSATNGLTGIGSEQELGERLENGVADGLFESLVLRAGSTVLATINFEDTGLSVISGAQRINIEADWNLTFQNIIDFLTNSDSFSELLAPTTAQYNTFQSFYTNTGAGVTGLEILDGGDTVFGFAVESDLLTVTGDGQRLEVDGTFPTDFGELFGVIRSVDEQVTVDSFNDVDGLDVTAMRILDDADDDVLVSLTGDFDGALTGDPAETFNATNGDDQLGGALFASLENDTRVNLRGGNDEFFMNEDDWFAAGRNPSTSSLINGGSGRDRITVNDFSAGRIEAVLGSGSVTVRDYPGGNNSVAYEVDTVSIESLTARLKQDATAFVVGSSSSNTIRIQGTSGETTLQGLGGADRIFGGSGSDLISGGAGGDLINGGSGRDTLTFVQAITGVTANLTTKTGTRGEAKNDTYASIENIVGSDFRDILDGNASANRIEGGDGNDTINGRSGNDVIRGEGGNDILLGGTGNDIFNGGAGADRIEGGGGRDTASYVDAGGGVTVNLSSGKGTRSDAQGDRLKSIEVVNGSDFRDILTGSNGANTLNGRDGNDVLKGLLGADVLIGGNGNDVLRGDEGADDLNGGNGFDWAYYTTSDEAVRVNLAAKKGKFGDAAGDTLKNIEYVFGSVHNDVLIGDAGTNYLVGNRGNDVISGGAGNDKLRGHKGEDVLTGGAGADKFEFRRSDGTDTIRDFEDNIDSLDLRSMGFNSVQDVLALATQDGDDVVFDLPVSTDRLIVLDTTIAMFNNDILI